MPDAPARAEDLECAECTGTEQHEDVLGGRTRIHIWAPVQHELERRALRKLERLLVANGRRCVVFAGLPIGSHETDLAVVVESLVLTIEAKSGTGAWRIMGPPLTRLRQDVQDRNGA